MKTQKEKYNYIAPVIECIQLDNDISLQLQSTDVPPGTDNETTQAPEYFNNDPFIANRV